MDASFILLHISTGLTFVLCLLIVRFKNKKALHYYFIFAFLAIFLWSVVSLIQQYIMPLDLSTTKLLNSFINSLLNFISILLFFVGYVYAKSGSKINKKINLLFLIPIINVVLLWTNDLHRSFYTYTQQGESVFGPLAYTATFINYAFLLLGLFYLIRFTIKNAGFFSKQSALIIMGALVPILVDVVYFTNRNLFPRYIEAISFTVTVICFLIAIFRFELFNIVPVALQTVVDHISDSYLVLNEHMELSDFNKTFSDTFGGVLEFKRKQKIDKILDSDAEYARIIMNKLEDATQKQRPLYFEIHIEKEDFDRYFIVEITPVITAGAIICTIILFKDITE